ELSVRDIGRTLRTADGWGDSPSASREGKPHNPHAFYKGIVSLRSGEPQGSLRDISNSTPCPSATMLPSSCSSKQTTTAWRCIESFWLTKDLLRLPSTMLMMR